jgi:hypothetical protein
LRAISHRPTWSSRSSDRTRSCTESSVLVAMRTLLEFQLGNRDARDVHINCRFPGCGFRSETDPTAASQDDSTSRVFRRRVSGPAGCDAMRRKISSAAGKPPFKRRMSGVVPRVPTGFPPGIKMSATGTSDGSGIAPV